MNKQNYKIETHNGYVTLTAVIIMLAVSAISLTAMMLISTSSLESSRNGLKAARARKAAETCAEIVLHNLRTNYTYIEGHVENLTAGSASCEVISVQGVGNEIRVVQLEGYVGNSVSRLEIEIQQINPITNITRWDFVDEL